MESLSSDGNTISNDEKRKDYDLTDKAGDELSPEPEPPKPHGVQLAMIMAVVLVVQFLLSLDQTIIATAIPRITDEFHGLDKVSWYGSAYFMTFSGTIPLWGKSLLYFPLKWVFLLALLLFEVGSLICGVAPNAVALIIGRALAGVGAGGVGTSVFSIITLSAEPQKRAKLMGLLISVYGIGAVCGPLIGGGFTSNVTWRWCFYLNLPVGGLVAIVTLISFNFHVKTQTATLKNKILHLDPVGSFVMMGGIIAFTLALQYGGQTMPWKSSTVIGLLVGCFLIFTAFFVWEAFQQEKAMIILRLCSQRPVWVGLIFQFFFASSYFIALYYLPIYFQSVLNVNPSHSGVRNIPLVVTMAISSIAGGMLLSKLGHYLPMMAIGSALSTVSCGLFYTFDENTTTGEWIGFQILAGFSWGCGWQCSLAAAQAGQSLADLPGVTSIVLVFQILGGSFGVSIAQCAFNNTMLKHAVSALPGIAKSLFLTTGATEIRNVFSPEEVPLVIAAYVSGLKVVWAITTGFSGVAFIVGFLGKWERLYQQNSTESHTESAA